MRPKFTQFALKPKRHQHEDHAPQHRNSNTNTVIVIGDPLQTCVVLFCSWATFFSASITQLCFRVMGLPAPGTKPHILTDATLSVRPKRQASHASQPSQSASPASQHSQPASQPASQPSRQAQAPPVSPASRSPARQPSPASQPVQSSQPASSDSLPDKAAHHKD